MSILILVDVFDNVGFCGDIEKEARRKSISFFLENKKQFINTKNVEKQIDHKQQKQKKI